MGAYSAGNQRGQNLQQSWNSVNFELGSLWIRGALRHWLTVVEGVSCTFDSRVAKFIATLFAASSVDELLAVDCKGGLLEIRGKYLYEESWSRHSGPRLVYSPR
jgi:hypothetical protein